MNRAMKDSGISWIGEIPSHWETDNIGSLYTQRNEKVSDKDYPPLSVSKMGVVPQLETAAKTDDGDNRKLVKKGDFVINSRSDRRGSCGISAYDGSVSLINTVLTPRTEMNPRFYDWLFHTSVFADEFYKWGHGIVDDLWTTRWAEMKRISIVVPPIPEQQAIADILDKKCGEIDRMILLQEKIIEELKAYRQSVITETVCKGLNPYVPMKNSEVLWIGDIPKNWETTRLGNFFILHSGDTLTSQEISEKRTDSNPFTVYGANGIRGYYKAFNLSKESILIGRVGALCGNVHLVMGNNWITEHALVAEARLPLCYSYYCYTIGAMNLGQYSKASAQPVISQETITQKRFPVPPLEEQQAIADYLDEKCGEIDTLIAVRLSKIEALKEYKKSIIYEYITGKKEVI